MKNIITALIILSLLPMIAMAQSDEQTERETKALDYVEGLEVRLLQLEKAIRTNIIRMDRAIDRVDESQRLEEKQRELYVLLSDVQEFEYETRSESIRKFTEQRRLANQISIEFREILSQLLDEETRNELRRDRSERAEVEDLRAEIVERIRMHNAQRVEEQRENLGIEREVVDRIIAGDLRGQEIRLELNRGLQISEDREALIEQRRQRAMQQAEQRREAISTAREGIVRETITQRRDRITQEDIQAINRERVQNIRNERIQNSNMYRVALRQGESHETRLGGFTLVSLSDQRAEFKMKANGEEWTDTINLGERKRVGNMWVSYYSKSDEAGVFIVGQINAQTTQSRGK